MDLMKSPVEKQQSQGQRSGRELFQNLEEPAKVTKETAVKGEKTC